MDENLLGVIVKRTRKVFPNLCSVQQLVLCSAFLCLSCHSINSDGTTDWCNGSKEWLDTVSDLCWQNPPSEDIFHFEEAAPYCDGLSSDGHDDWRLPNISELRSLIRGCDRTMLGGVCGVTDECFAESCWTDESCGFCGVDGVNGTGCYWDETLGECGWFWSETQQSADRAWGVCFNGGEVSDGIIGEGHDDYGEVICVRQR